MTEINKYLEVFRNKKITIVALLGFSSGLPLALTGGTLQAWMTVDGIDLSTIGVFALVGIPYTFKFLWSPMMDRYAIPFLGRRRGWILITQIGLILGIIIMASLSPKESIYQLGILALIIAFLSASQDIVIDAYRTDILHEKERGAGVAVHVMGYRIAMLVSGAFALIISEVIGWRNTYLLMAALILLGVIATFFGDEPKNVSYPRNFNEAILGPLKNYFSKEMAIALLFLIILYKLGDAYAGTMTTPFLIRGIGFSAGEVGALNKGLGFISVIFGALVGGTLMARLGLYNSLLVFGILQAISNLSFMVLSWVGKSYGMLIFAVAFENISGGMGTTAFVSLLMAICDQRYSATQYALLSSLASLGRIFISPTSGFLVESVGWSLFFFITALLAIPGLWLLFHMRNELSHL
jgi:PAT family beta-lactamase induction signal transducer AmpG